MPSQRTFPTPSRVRSVRRPVRVPGLGGGGGVERRWEFAPKVCRHAADRPPGPRGAASGRQREPCRQGRGRHGPRSVGPPDPGPAARRHVLCGRLRIAPGAGVTAAREGAGVVEETQIARTRDGERESVCVDMSVCVWGGRGACVRLCTLGFEPPRGVKGLSVITLTGWGGALTKNTPCRTKTNQRNRIDPPVGGSAPGPVGHRPVAQRARASWPWSR
jgi:hypothetical protein